MGGAVETFPLGTEAEPLSASRVSVGVNVRRRVVLVLVVALLLAGIAPAGGVGSADATAGDAGEVTSVSATVGSLQAENNTTVRHRDPDETGEDGNLAAVRRNLAGRMGEISVDCSEGIRIGNYDACEELNGSYSDALSKYVDVTGRDAGGTENDTQSAESFDDLQDETREFANETQRFRETYREYQEARRNGNTTRARRLARELLELRNGIQRTGANVSRASNEVGNQTGVSLAAVRENTQAVTANVSNTTDTVVTDIFVSTAITATRAETGNVSARDPLVVTGEVRTDNGTLVRSGSIVLVTGPGRGSRTVDRTRVAVADDGTYRLTYRPVTVRTGDRTLAVRYEPPATSVYLPANESVDATIEGVRASVEVSDTAEAVRYRDSVRTGATVTTTASGEPVALQGVPLEIRVDGRTLATGRTNATGVATLQSRFPAGIAPGERTLTVVGPSSNRAVTVDRVSRTLQVRSTATALDVRAVQTAVGERSVRVAGRLEARDGGVPAQELAVRIDGQQVGTVETNATGHYRETVLLPNASAPSTGSEQVALVVAFDGAGTNLESTRARQQLSVQGAEASANGGISSGIIGSLRENPLVAGAAGLSVVGLLVAGGVVLVRRRRESADEGATGGVATSGQVESPGEAGKSGDGPAAGPDEATIRDALSNGEYARAVLSGYAAVRRGLPVGEAPAVTHWEFYRRAAESGLSEARLEALRDVTEAFERVSYAGETPGEEEAATVLERVRNVLDENESDVDATAADD